MIIRLTHPLISCICITANRPTYLLKAIIGFDSQGYPNKELIISYPKSDPASKNLVEEIMKVANLKITTVERDDDLSLGMARNEAVAISKGEYICTWDDDDWFGDSRLAHQYNNMLSVKQKREASMLTNIMLYDSINDIACLSQSYKWAGSLLCKKDLVLQHPYVDSDVAEDIQLIKYLDSSKYLHLIPDRPDLYAFIYHGANVIDQYQYKYLLRYGQLFDDRTKEWLKSVANGQPELVQS